MILSINFVILTFCKFFVKFSENILGSVSMKIFFYFFLEGKNIATSVQKIRVGQVSGNTGIF